MPDAPPRDFVIPIDGLTIPGPWQVGVVEFLDPDSTRKLVRSHASASRQNPKRAAAVDEFLDGLTFASAHVRAESREAATDLVGSALEVLRVFQQSEARWVTTMFGLPGELRSLSQLAYLEMGEEAAGVGWHAEGHHAGWTFRDQPTHFQAHPGFVFAAHAVGKPQPTEGERRALLGIQLASLAILEHRPGPQLLFSVMAAEAMLLKRDNGPQAHRLAQRCAFFLCGREDQETCARQADTCPALGNDPSTRPGLAALKAFRVRGNLDDRWRCSEWHHVLDWYDIRSEVVHAGQLQAAEGEAGQAIFWLVTRLVPEVLNWLADHPETPIDDLDAAIRALPDPPDWEQILGG
jgi:hypothetical protein